MKVYLECKFEFPRKIRKGETVKKKRNLKVSELLNGEKKEIEIGSFSFFFFGINVSCNEIQGGKNNPPSYSLPKLKNGNLKLFFASSNRNSEQKILNFVLVFSAFFPFVYNFVQEKDTL
jgi:hypothetical protein